MGDVSAEPSMEDILSSIKRIIAEEGDNGPAPARSRRAPRPIAPTVSEPADDEAADDDEILELSDPVSTPKPAAAGPARPAAAPKPADSILSRQTAEASRGALDALSRMIVKPETAGADTLEGLVREMLRPMLRDWLDAHLPEMVEQMVAREIARISGQAD